MVGRRGAKGGVSGPLSASGIDRSAVGGAMSPFERLDEPTRRVRAYGTSAPNTRYPHGRLREERGSRAGTLHQAAQLEAVRRAVRFIVGPGESSPWDAGRRDGAARATRKMIELAIGEERRRPR